LQHPENSTLTEFNDSRADLIQEIQGADYFCNGGHSVDNVPTNQNCDSGCSNSPPFPGARPVVIPRIFFLAPFHNPFPDSPPTRLTVLRIVLRCSPDPTLCPSFQPSACSSLPDASPARMLSPPPPHFRARDADRPKVGHKTGRSAPRTDGPEIWPPARPGSRRHQHARPARGPAPRAQHAGLPPGRPG
jgi:hypothetical protein